MKEDAPVDVSITMTPTQLLLLWTLLGFLLTWMVFFAVLALRPAHRKRAEFEDLTASSRHPSIASTPSLHVLVPSSVNHTQSHSGLISNGPSGDVGAASMSR